MSQNALTGALPAALPAVAGGGGQLGLSLFDNSFQGSVPATYASLAWLAMSYCPGLIGALPTGLTSAKLFAYSASLNGYYALSYATGGSGGAAFGMPPSSAGAGSGSGWLYGTAIGLDRPLASILLAIAAAADPGGAVLGAAWTAPSPGTLVQPCRAWSNGSAAPAQLVSSPVLGAGWRYISAAGAEFCQDWLVAANTQLDGTSAVNQQPTGGISALFLVSLGLAGAPPVELRELRTAVAISLANNSLAGNVPPCWCVASRCRRRQSMRAPDARCPTPQGPVCAVVVVRAHVRLRRADEPERQRQRAQRRPLAVAGKFAGLDCAGCVIQSPVWQRAHGIWCAAS